MISIHYKQLNEYNFRLTCGGEITRFKRTGASSRVEEEACYLVMKRELNVYIITSQSSKVVSQEDGGLIFQVSEYLE